jgi:hypothetical protein
MTELEKMQWQSEQDQITLDYSKWSQQRVSAKLSNDHNLWKEQRDDVLARWQVNNAETRRKYLDGLEAAKAEKQSQRDAEVDQSLMPEKQRLMREWLVNNTDKNEADFDKLAWTYLKQNLIEQGEMDNREAMRNSLLRSGRYAL